VLSDESKGVSLASDELSAWNKHMYSNHGTQPDSVPVGVVSRPAGLADNALSLQETKARPHPRRCLHQRRRIVKGENMPKRVRENPDEAHTCRANRGCVLAILHAAVQPTWMIS